MKPFERLSRPGMPDPCTLVVNPGRLGTVSEPPMFRDDKVPTLVKLDAVMPDASVVPISVLASTEP
jgi:hypothetical protein